MSDEQQKRFETWVVSDDGYGFREADLSKLPSGSYRISVIRMMFEAWKGAEAMAKEAA